MSRKPGAFLELERRAPDKEPAAARTGHWREFERRLPVVTAREQASRCMSCGVPFCHAACPLGNRIPDWNDLVARDRWPHALASLEATNNFPEFTGRVCPAPCEASCVLELHRRPVSIKAIEREVADRAWDDAAVAPVVAERRTGRRVAVVGSGPAGLACAQQLARAGHDVTVFERDDRVGGLLRYGIPDFKLDKALVERRVAQMRAEGVSFRTGVDVGRTVSLEALRATHDAVVLATGAARARELDVPGRALRGVHLAMDYLTRANRLVAGDDVPERLDAAGLRVVILGGGDTGSDCLGTALRQGAASVTQLELMPRPPDARAERTPWPLWPDVFRVSTSQEEGGARDFALRTVALEGDDDGRVRALVAERLTYARDADGRLILADAGERVRIDADLVLLAMGFTGPEAYAWEGSALELDPRGCVRADAARFATSAPGVFACGDARRGQSLVVWAIWEGREAARAVDLALMGETWLPTVPAAPAMG